MSRHQRFPRPSSRVRTTCNKGSRQADGCAPISRTLPAEQTSRPGF